MVKLGTPGILESNWVMVRNARIFFGISVDAEVGRGMLGGV